VFWWLPHKRRAVLAEADERMEYFGNEAYRATRAEAREARKRGDKKRDLFLGRVALEIAKRTDFEPGLDTATRYLEEQASYDHGPALARPNDTTLH